MLLTDAISNTDTLPVPPALSALNAISTTKHFLKTLNIIEQDWDTWYEEVHKCDQEAQDLLHEIEFTKFEIQRGYKLAKQLQEVRQRRRDLKNTMETMRTLKDFLDSNKQMKINLYKILTSMEKMKEHQGQRIYTPRVRTDITLAEGLG
jgi:predicted RNase H-like nuclease (RuvC/YqgF family)